MRSKYAGEKADGAQGVGMTALRAEGWLVAISPATRVGPVADAGRQQHDTPGRGSVASRPRTARFSMASLHAAQRAEGGQRGSLHDVAIPTRATRCVSVRNGCCRASIWRHCIEFANTLARKLLIAKSVSNR